MPDREKVIKAIECCVVNHTRCFDDSDKLCPYFSTKVYMCEIELLKDALALLKEQEAVVRCKDCVRKEKIEGTENIIYCPHVRMRTSVDWFCADGERKE